MLVSIHQPNLMAYSGLLEKIERSDLFVVMNHVQFSRGKYHNRFEHDGEWYTMSINQALRPLIEKRYAQPVKDWVAIKRKLPAYADVLEEFDEFIGPSLVETNTTILRRTCELLGITTPIVEDYPSSYEGTERLLDICQHYGATEYLSGPSGAKYLDEDMFNKNGIGVRYQMQVKPRSAIDLLKERA